MGKIMMTFLWVAALILVVVLAGCADHPHFFPGKTKREKPFFERPMPMAAHRGGAGLWPENTLFAFTNAFARWPECIIETDARLTRDGHVVLIHDPTVDRTTNGSGLVSDMTLSEIKSLDAGYTFTPDEGETFPWRGRGLRVPTLEEVVQALPSARLQIDLKEDARLPAKLINLVREHQAEKRVLLASFDPMLMSRARRLAPELATCYDFRSGALMLNWLRQEKWELYLPHDDVLSLDLNMIAQFKLTREEAQAVQDKGIVLQVHIINDPELMREWLEYGVDSIITDYPDRLAKLLQK
jgi:glycerophosphoryl diester phosphodiesterase